MKLYLDLDNYDYQPERYKYAVEQMMLTLFPEERPEYPPREGRTLKGETNAARFTLRRSPVWTTVRAQVYRPQGMGQAAVRVGSGQLDRPPEQVYHTLQHALKMAFYQAGTALLGGEPPWGALTGVRPVKLPARAMKGGATPAQAREELEREYRVLYGRNLTLSRLPEAVVLPLCPDKGTCLSYDPNLSPSVYLENDVEQLLRQNG